jgi:hypothetical protein
VTAQLRLDVVGGSTADELALTAAWATLAGPPMTLIDCRRVRGRWWVAAIVRGVDGRRRRYLVAHRLGDAMTTASELLRRVEVDTARSTR